MRLMGLKIVSLQGMVNLGTTDRCCHALLPVCQWCGEQLPLLLMARSIRLTSAAVAPFKARTAPLSLDHLHALALLMCCANTYHRAHKHC